MLQLSSAQSGRCEGCNRWIFGKEKVMWCGCCNLSYCSTCAPAARGDTNDTFWEDLLNTMGSALRDAERIKGRLANEIVNIDLERIKSTFTCQAPQTLSAEVIVIEHAFEQAKTALSCSKPDISDLHSQEEVFHHSALQQNSTTAEDGGAKPASDEQTNVDNGGNVNLAPELSSTSGPKPGTDEAKPSGAGIADLLDLDEPVVAPKADASSVPAAGAVQDETKDLLDLLDLPAQETPASSTPEANVVTNLGQDASEDLLDMASLPVVQAPVSITTEANAGTSQASSAAPEASENLADIVSMPVLEKPAASATPGVNQVAVPAAEVVQHQTKDLLDITNLPADKTTTNDLEDLLDLRVQTSTVP